LDIAVLVPFQSWPSSWIDPTVRTSLAATKLVAIRARDRLIEFLGRTTDGPRQKAPPHRSLTAVALATSLERAGLRWRALDPGAATLASWRVRLESLRADKPRLVAISSTFVNDGFWIASLCELVRRTLPGAQVAVGGYYYASDAKQFLSLDADIFCVGEGEVRIVQITQAVRDGRGLESIPGLYLRGRGGRLRYTGDVEPLHLDELPLPDWSLSARIDPPVDPQHEPLHYSVETQRGCVFKCEFCTFRTLAAPMLATVERGVEAIRDAGARGRGMISVIDATATYPRDRWRVLLERLIDQGGSPLPLSIWARMSDIDEDVCALMAKAGVHQVQIGQESGDQRMLNAMRKGTRVSHVAPAIAALHRHRILAATSFLYGFPGETVGSMETTRRLIASINDGYESWPVVRSASISLFDALDFAGVGQREILQERRRYGWSHLEVTPGQAAAGVMETYLQLSRVPHAPSTGFGVSAARWQHFEQTPGGDQSLEFFRWAKAIDRGIGVFVEEELEGKRPDLRELSRVRDTLLSRWPAQGGDRTTFGKAWARARHRARWHVAKEWIREPASGIGPLTRLAIGWEVGKATGRADDALRAIRSGSYPNIGFVAATDAAAASETRGAAEQLIQVGIATGKRKLPRAG
jgi:anaerobic magnesium-protoporphyrin IX monomethyl ester cyclase